MQVHIDVPMPVSYASIDLARELEKLEPYGVGNPRPLFAQKGLRLIGGRRIGARGQFARLTVEAEIVSRHEDVSVHHHNTGDGMDHVSHSTTYYVTFQVASGDRMEFQVPRREYGFLVEGDRGRLSFQGTRFLGFERM